MVAAILLSFQIPAALEYMIPADPRPVSFPSDRTTDLGLVAGMTAGDLAQGLLETYRWGFGYRDMETQMYQTVAYIVAK